MQSCHARATACFSAGILLAAAAAFGAPGPAPREVNFPPECFQVEIAWKPTWDETLAANPQDKWQQELSQNKAFAGMWQQVAWLRRIELLKAMIQRFSQDKDRHAQAYTEIARAYQNMGMDWWRSYWGWKLVQDFPDRPEAQEQGYQFMLSWSFGTNTHWGWYGYWMRPECKDWEFAINEVIEKHAAGKLPAASQVLTTACADLASMQVDFLDYGRFHSTIRRLNELGPGFEPFAAGMLETFGHLTDKGPEMLVAPSPTARADMFELETRWERAQHGPLFRDSDKQVDAEEVQTLLDLFARTDAQFLEGNRYTPFWTLLDRRLTSLPAARLQSLCGAQDAAARLLAAAARMGTDARSLRRAFRRYPFATCLHERMIEQAEDELRTGRVDWAIPSLRDVIRHSADREVRLQACAALWMALSQRQAGSRELAPAFALVQDGERMPWRGGHANAGEVKRELLAAARATETADSRKLADLPRHLVRLPEKWPAREFPDGPCADFGLSVPWPVTQVEQAGKCIFVSSPTAVARFDSDGAAPAWMLSLPERTTDADWPFSVAEGRAVASSPVQFRQDGRRPVRVRRWPELPPSARLCFLLNTQVPPCVGAVDALSGAMLWSTEALHGWDGLMPISQPAVHGDRVYVLAAPADMPRETLYGPGQTGKGPTLHLVCLDAADGRLLWTRAIGRKDDTFFDLSRGAAAPVVYDGSVYCAANIGVLARCSAGDGTIEWLSSYHVAVHRNGGVASINPRREGSAPVLVRAPGGREAGDTILLAPRDHTGIVAFNRQTGEPLWETPMVPSDKLVGVSGRSVVGVNEHWLTALDLDTGEQLFCREFPEGTGSQAALVGPDVIIVSGGKACRINASTGDTVEEQALETMPNGAWTIMPGGAMVQVVAPPLSPPPGLSTADRTVSLPLKEVWSVRCESPSLALRKIPGAARDSFAVLSGRRLGVVSARPNWHMAWDRLLPVRPQAVDLAGSRVVVAGQSWNIAAYDADAGRKQWSLDLPIMPAELIGDDGIICAAAVYGPGGTPHYAAIEAATGKLLWCRNISNGHVGGSPTAFTLRREPDGVAALRAMLILQYPDVGGRLGEAVVDATTGAIRQTRPLLPPGHGFWSTMVYDEKGLGWFHTANGPLSEKKNNSIRTARFEDGSDAAAGWQRELDLQPLARHRNRAAVHLRGAGVYARMAGQLLFFDPATAQETVFDLSRPGDVIQPFIFDFREAGDMLVVVSGFLPAQDAAKSDPVSWKLFVDLFERATGRNTGRQELPGVVACVKNVGQSTVTGYETQAVILDDSIVVTDVSGVHVFAADPQPPPQPPPATAGP